MVEVREYIDADNRNHFERWFNALNVPAALRVRTYLARIESGNFSAVKGVGSGVFECRINFGPGYRVYFGKDGERIVILLGSGTKKRQQHDIQRAIKLWNEYKVRKREQ